MKTDSHREAVALSLAALAGGGQMGELIRSFDWTRTALGAIEHWPASLKTAVSLMLNSRHPMWIGWGPEATFLYNDAYVQVLSLAKHPWALGRPAAEVWAEIWDVCGPLANKVFAHGEATFVDDVRLFMSRGDFLEETYYSFSYSPIRDESGRVAGLFCPSAETTAKVLNARRLRTLSALAEHALIEKTTAAACAAALRTLAQNPDDIPFALLYLLNDEGSAADLVGCAGISELCDSIAPARVDFSSDAIQSEWPITAVAQQGIARSHSVEHLQALPPGPAERRVTHALLLPVGAGDNDRPLGVLIAGVNPTRKLDHEYRTFFELSAGQIATAIRNVRAIEEQQQRADALAELDRAKTAFFSNISHEFRTPLTLMLGPIEDALNDDTAPLPPVQRERISTAHRNSGRLLRLVNTLLDFSRIEAGRSQARFEPVDLAMLIRDIASNFTSALQRAGLSFVIDCESPGEPIYVDRDMWEKIVLNLLSNAFKFTFEGGVTVRLARQGDGIELRVSDSGVGIPEHELPRLFERFHRIAGQKGRSFEGSGIGLALIQELVRLHGGHIHASSTVGQGTTFFVWIPFGSAHLPADRIQAPPKTVEPTARASAFVREALGWLPQSSDQLEEFEARRELARLRADKARPLIVLADDNADMRNYVSRLFGDEIHVRTAADGHSALSLIRAQRPDLVISDVMMPGLDGFGLLKAIRDDAQLRDLPVILLSARAGEEARVEGLNAGADDYLTKPFSARELIARVRANIELARVRRESRAALAESEARFRNMADHAPVMMWVTETDGRCSYLNRAWYAFTGQTREQAEGFGWLEATHPDDRGHIHRVFCTANEQHEAFRLEYRLRRRDGEYRWAIDAASPRFGGNGEFLGYIGSVIDITERKQAEELLEKTNVMLSEQVERELAARLTAEESLRQSQKMEALGQLAGGIAHDFNNMLVVVIGNLDMLLRRLDRGETNIRRFVDRALEGANRAATLTQRLLAFARQQPMSPEVLNINKLVANMADLLHRTLGEAIRTETVLAGGLWRVYTDANQLESALVNLAVNARDAMPEGGKLTIETANAHLDDAYAAQHAGIPPGQYVMVAVTDTGSGMPPEVIARAFDPFFTTKPVGKGTGLGLSQVHGFVHQSKGHVKIYSEMGQGTTVKIYLPRFFGNAETNVSDVGGRAIPRAARSTTVLLVEDEEGVRVLAREALQELGYTVVDAGDARVALTLLDAHPEIDLLFTDVVMPDINGRKLADEALKRRPDLKVLYTTGYTRNAIVHNGMLDPGVHFIGKPFTLEQLGRKLAEVLRS